LWPWLLRGLVLHAVRSLNSRRGPASIWAENILGAEGGALVAPSG
jgi:hypothetical protein